jgi:RND family efflux transporter MFP subunit
MNTFKIFAALSLFVLLSCTQTDKETRLQELVEQRKELDLEIKELKKEIAADGNPKDVSSVSTLVKVRNIVPETFRRYIEVQGIVETDMNILLPAEKPGLVNKIYIEKGDKVKKGQLLAEIDDILTKSTIEEVENGLELATIVYERQKRLWDKKIGSEIQYLEAKNTKENLEKKLETLEESYRKRMIKSPFDGVVDEVLIKEGEMAIAGIGAIRVVQLSSLKISANLSDKYISSVKKGDTVNITFPGGGICCVKTIDAVSQVINPDTRTFAIEIELSKEQNSLKPNMLAILDISDYIAEDAIVVPINTIQQKGDEKFLFLAVRDGDIWRAKKQTVETGYYQDDMIEVVEGLKVGDNIITVGFQSIANGEVIKIQE